MILGVKNGLICDECLVNEVSTMRAGRLSPHHPGYSPNLSCDRGELNLADRPGIVSPMTRAED